MRFLAYLLAAPCMAAVSVSAGGNATPRELLGVDRLRSVLTGVSQSGAHVSTGLAGKGEFSGASEAFHLARRGNEWIVSGNDPSGLLYGCLELARRANETGRLPQKIDFTDHFGFRLALRYAYSHDVADLEDAAPLLRESVQHYGELAALTDKTYREGPSVHSSSRKIPFLGAPGKYTHWRDCLPAYEPELAIFERNLKAIEISVMAPSNLDCLFEDEP